MAASVLPTGPTSLLDLMQENPLAWEGKAWPQQLWICATRRADGRRVVFGRHGSPSVPLPHAVAASSAIPSHFSAVVVDDTEYCDGGLYSPTNADLLAELNLDLVIIISPMSGGLARPTRLSGARPGADFGRGRWPPEGRKERRVLRAKPQDRSCNGVESDGEGPR